MTKLKKILWGILSLLVSGLFVFHGVYLLSLAKLPQDVAIYSLVNIAYGIISLVMLALSFVKPKEILKIITVIIVSLFFAYQVIMSFDSNTISGFELVALVMIGLMLSSNWISVRNNCLYNVR